MYPIKPKGLTSCGCSYDMLVESDGKFEWCCSAHGQRSELDEQDPLEGRVATCCYGNHAEVDSDYDLPFFQYRPGRSTDTYYCGCEGWD